MELKATHRQILRDSAISDEVIDSSGITSYDHPEHGSGIRFPWCDGMGALPVFQIRPDSPQTDSEGNPVKYLFPKGTRVPLNRLRDGETRQRLIIAEGTKQQYAVLSHAPADFAVYGMSGCWGYKEADLTIAHDREVFLLMDSDFTTNSGVYAATSRLAVLLKKHGATSVKFVTTTGTGKEGVDDALSRFPEEQRGRMLRLWLSQAEESLGKRPPAKKPKASKAGPEKYFRVRDEPLSLHPNELAEDIIRQYPAAITAEGNIALYENGVYRVDPDAILSVVVTLLNEYFTPGHLKTSELFVRGILRGQNRMLPEQTPLPLLNCPNTMVDLRTGEQLPHSPDHLSCVQIPVEYDADAECPLYDSWLKDALRQDGASESELQALVDDLEEVAGTMLDPTRTPSKALFLFGAARTGKSTFLRILKAVAGVRNTSAVTLHDLVSDPFAGANLYGKMLNVAADLSNRHVEDLSIFKMVTGEDPVKGNRKYGQQFMFTNQSLIAFSANELPTVSEASRAYSERTKPFEFPNSFAGREDKHLEGRLMAELPGILARWVRAYRRFLDRGGYAPTHEPTLRLFEAKSDRVAQFFQDMCTLTPANPGQRLSEELCSPRRDVVVKFNDWAQRNGGSKIGERAFFQRLRSLQGVTEVRNPSRSVCFNLTVAKDDEDVWPEDEPVAEPLEGTGVVEADASFNPWGPPVAQGTPDLPPVPRPEPLEGPGDDDVPRLVPVSTAPLNGSQNGSHAFQVTYVPEDDGGTDPWI